MDKESYTFIVAFAGVVFGAVGTVLGIINFWRALIKDQTKIKVYPQLNAFLENDSEQDGKVVSVARMCVEVINLSDFPVTINDVGFILNKYLRNGKVTFLDKQIMHGGKLPQRMEPRTSITVFHPNPALFINDAEKICGAYATTQCGKEFRGGNKALKKFLKEQKATA